METGSKIAVTRPDFYGDLTELIFEVHPKFSYEAALQLEAYDSEHPKYDLYLKRKHVEDEVNQSLLEEAINKDVKLGDFVQLYHPKSKKYLNFSKFVDNLEKSNLRRLNLSQKTSSSLHFRILSKIGFRKTGMNVKFNEGVYFQSIDDLTITYPLSSNQ